MFNIFKKETPPKIEFRCLEKHWGVIPQPYPARKFMPDWYKSLTPRLINNGVEEDNLRRENGFETNKSYKGKQETRMRTSTIKRCPPFLDAMTTGWIIPLAADIWIKSNKDCSMLRWDHGSFPDTLIEEHGPAQLNSEKHPSFPKWPFKWLNYWSIKVPKGWSVWFFDPINRQNPLFECISGLVDCDGYEEFINFPFFWNKPDWEGKVQQGTPLIQVVPIRRDNFEITSDIHVFTPEELQVQELHRARHRAHESYYRDSVWIKNKGKS